MTQSKKIDILTIKYKVPIRYEEIGKFRGALLHEVGVEEDLFHNHKGDGFHYRYPLIQYKRIGGSAGLMILGEANRAMVGLSKTFGKSIRVGDRREVLEVDFMRSKTLTVRMGKKMFTYKLLNWMGLNSENYQHFQEIEDIEEKVAFLEQILCGQILAFCYGIDYDPPMQLKVEFLEIERDKVVPYKGQTMQAFDLIFRTNIFLPNHIGLGKGVSIGMGTVEEV
ncbi:hypothetical protein K4L44_06550 [Halosquirtibacter laminarini]|uniref:Uncharacterized protein n=1 Tax=Halosquirtibacter laminarini TaxID=3374600 RepID=A0AC61NIE7_9BACT|nr:hypothetical protein K4L44_06550 [Prolixibacteraceae bacterium]